MLETINTIFRSNPLFQGGFLLGAITATLALLSKISIYFYHQIKRRVIYTVNISEDSIVFEYFEKYLNNFYKDQYNVVDIKYFNSNMTFMQLEDTFIIKYKGKRIKIFKGRTKLENSQNISTMFYNNFTLHSIRGKKIINEFLNEVIDYNNKLQKDNKSTYLYYFNKDKFEYITDLNIKSKSIDDVIIKEKEILINDIDSWISNKDWYSERSIPYKRGILFYGLPGNGKTSAALAVAKKYQKHIYVLNLNDLTDENLNKAFMHLTPDTVLLIEDIDCAFDEERNKISDNETKFSFSTLLNCLDGVFSVPNVITIFTTNHIKKLDPALIRPGRIDLKFEITNPNDQQIKEYVELFYKREISSEINASDKICMAEVQNICLSNINDVNNAIKFINMKNK